MHASRIVLSNWGPFAGEHSLELGPGVYGVAATRDDDPGVSNWQGKSWFLGSILFALTGQRPEGCETEDAWITRGADAGAVELWLSTGVRIRRERRRGKSTQLVVEHAGGKASGVDAQALIDRLTGLGPDLATTCVVRQKQVDRMVTAKPAERTAMIAPWFGLEPLQRAEQAVRVRLSGLTADDAALAAEEKSLTERLDELRKAQVADDGAARLAEIDEQLRERRAAMEAEVERHRLEGRAAEFERLRARGVELRAEHDALPEPVMTSLDEALSEATIVLGAVQSAVGQARELVVGEWDRQGPLSCSECPAADQVERGSRAAEERLDALQADLEAAEAKAAGASEAVDDAREAIALKQQVKRRLEQLREDCTAMLPDVDAFDPDAEAQDIDALNAECDELRREQYDLEAGRRVARRVAEEVAGIVAKLDAHRVARAELEHKIARHREALAVLGRNGAQRDVAEAALARIEAGANAMLADAGVALTVQVQWARETDQLADACDQCGAPFPASRRVRECARCKAERGPKLVEKLNLVLSDRSGAADDFAGLAVQLSAAAWLRSRRSAAWSVVAVDEPFAAADPVNARRMSGHLHAMIRGRYAFEQGFVVAHDAALMEAFPLRVTITGGATGSRLEVA